MPSSRKTLDGIVTAWNPAAERLFGYTEREMVGQSIFVLIPDELHAEEQDLLQRIRRGERVDFADAERIRKDGGRIDIALTVSPVFNAAGEVVGASSIKRDITERKRAGAELARREERYRALVTATTSIVWTADPEGHFDGRQASWQAYTGQGAKDQEGYGWMNAVHADDRESFRASWIQARDQRTIWEYRTGRLWSQAHRSHRHFIARAVPVVGVDGEIREWIGTVTDGEDRWLAEERLRQAERLESVGRLAGGIAHEANNQMTVILGAAEFLDRAISDDYVPGGRGAHPAGRPAYRGDHPAAPRLQPPPGAPAAGGGPQHRDPRWSRSCSARWARSRSSGYASRPIIGQVRADPGQLDQVLLNLALNARDAMPDRRHAHHRDGQRGGGRTRGRCAMALDPVTPGSYVVLIVSDTGAGMDRETLAHVFEPFFTTKGVGEGTGLGLATVYGIVKQSGGFVSVHSEPGRGTSFRIYLPIATPDPRSRARRLVGRSGRRQRDDPRRRRRAVGARDRRPLAARVRVHRTRCPRRLPTRWSWPRSSDEPPDLLIADVVMPGMGGKQLAEALADALARHAGAVHLGLHRRGRDRRRLLDEGREFLQKPLEPEAMARRVRQILDARVNRPASP